MLLLEALGLDREKLPLILLPGLLAAGIGSLTFAVMRLGLLANVLARRRPWLVLPAAGIVVALLAVLFQESTDKGIEEALFSGQDAIVGLTAGAASWSIGALLLALILKGLAWGISLGNFRGGRPSPPFSSAPPPGSSPRTCRVST